MRERCLLEWVWELFGQVDKAAMGAAQSSALLEVCCWVPIDQKRLASAAETQVLRASSFFERQSFEYEQCTPTAAETLEVLLADGHADLGRRVQEASSKIPPDLLEAWAALADQSIRVGIDYQSLGLGHFHPETRLQYRQGSHSSCTAPASRWRATQSRQELRDIFLGCLDANAAIQMQVTEIEKALVRAFLHEIGAPATTRASADGVAAALRAELLQPLRALNEGQACMRTTFSKEPIPAGLLAQAIKAITEAVLSKPGGFSEWRYTNPVGREQLRGLTQIQADLWRQATSLAHEGGLVTHEDDDSELGFFWATKIGGPSHGFDYEAQCLLPLLCNARNKVLLVSDPSWPDHPAGRFHWRLLWAADDSVSFASETGKAKTVGPRLWLEALHVDFEALREGLGSNWVKSGLKHAISKACRMEAPLLVELGFLEMLRTEALFFGDGEVCESCERLILRPSNGVLEASDYLSNRHDWVQLDEGITEPLPRAMYIPPGAVNPKKLFQFAKKTSDISLSPLHSPGKYF
ncbi:unnamed protein product [Polarella glacialis]|uniref:Uncharacterized protein n=1 Tax=Polarella glacialis TaxID=89957 RepID=A0A813KIT3_POLGL|nr:unnamed protein product [Polarella glacialis]